MQSAVRTVCLSGPRASASPTISRPLLTVATLLAAMLIGTSPAFSQGMVTDGIAAVVNDKVITFSEVKKQIGRQEEELRNQYQGDQLMSKVREVRNSALKARIDRQLIIQDFNKAGLFIPDTFIDQRIKDVISTEWEGDRTAFIKTLLANGMTLADYKQDTRENIIVQAMRQKNVSSTALISPYRIEQFYQENVRQFVQEEQVQLHVIFLRKPLFKEKRKNAAGEDEEYDQAEALMQDIVTKLDSGSTFEELAKGYSEGFKREDGGDMGWVVKSALRSELGAVAFQLRPGQHSEIIATSDGYYLLRVDDVKRASVQPMQEVRSQIEKTLLQEEKQRLQQEWIDGLREKAYIKMF